MTSPEINIFFAAEITFKHRTDFTTKTLTFTNKPTEDVSATDWYPLLLSVSGLGLAVGQSGAAVASSGSVTLDDSWGGFGKNRRVSDLLARYTPIDQTVTVKACYTQLSDQYPTGDWVTIWAGICSDVQASSESLSIGIESLRIKPKYASKLVTAAAFPSAPSSSLGKSIPLIFGNCTVPAISISTDATEGEFVFATNWGAQFETGAIQNWYCKDDDGEYLEVSDQNSTTPIDGGSPPTGSTYPTPSGLSECMVGWLTASQKKIIVGGEWYFRGQGGGASYSGSLIFRLYTSTIQQVDAYVLHRETAVPKSDYAADITGGSNFDVKFKWDTPFVYNVEKHGFIYLSCQLTNYTGSTTDFVHAGTDGSQTGYFLRATTGQFQASSDYKPRHGLYCLELTESHVTTPDEDGFGYSAFAVEQDTSGYPAGGSPVISDLEFAVNTGGLIDKDGLIGSVGVEVTTTYKAIKMLATKYNGSAWVNDTDVWDFTGLATITGLGFGFYPRIIKGYTQGSETVQELIEQICSEMQCKVVQRVNGKLDLYAIGDDPTVSKVYTDENSTLQGWRFLDTSSVVNRIKLYYDQDLLNLQLESSLNSDSIGNFAQTLDWGLDTSVYTNFLTAASQELFGAREIQELQLNWVGDSTTAENIATLTFMQYDMPHWIVQLEVPFWDNRTVELMDAVELLSPRMPAYFGTSARADLPTVEGEEVDLIQGHYWKQAKRYTCQVIGRDVTFDENEFPSILLTLRVIKPYHPNDPTVSR